MSGERDVGAFIQDMVDSAEAVVILSRGIADDELMRHDGPLRAALLHHLMVMGEAAKHVPQETREAWPQIPWSRISGLRDRVVHYYFGLSDAALLLIVREAVPGVLPPLATLLAKIDADAEGS